jgi:hypothetical protein
MKKEAFISGLIGGLSGLVLFGAVFSWMGVELLLINLYVGFGLCGFFGSFFGNIFASRNN